MTSTGTHTRGRGAATSARVSATADGAELRIGRVAFAGKSSTALEKGSAANDFSNGTDTFYERPISDGGALVLYKFTPDVADLTASPYPTLTLPGGALGYTATSPDSPYFATKSASPPTTFTAPFKDFKWPALTTDADSAVFPVAESPVTEEAIEPFLSAYPSLRLTEAPRPDTLQLRFGGDDSPPVSTTLSWHEAEHTADSTTYVTSLPDANVRTIALHIPRSDTIKRVWFGDATTWSTAATQRGGAKDPDLLVIHVKNAQRLLIETTQDAPPSEVTTYALDEGPVQRARWAAFAVYDHEPAETFFQHSMVPALKAYNQLMYQLRDRSPVRDFGTSWKYLLRKTAFTAGHNLLDPKYFDKGFSAAADPSFSKDPRLNVSVSWTSDEAALQAVMGRRLFGFEPDARYARGVASFYSAKDNFYNGAFVRSSRKYTTADTASDGVVIGYNYLLSLTRLTELIGTPQGLPRRAVESLVDRVLPVLQKGYVAGYPQVPYLWTYPNLSVGAESEYGMGRELSEAQLSYICGLWWRRTHLTRYATCEAAALRLPEKLALTIRGSSYLWGLDVVHGSYVMDALLLAYKNTGQRHYLDAALGGWREELFFLFSQQNYPETAFDDRGMAVTSYYSTFADLHTGNYWRGDSWNNSRTMWSLAKVLAYVADPRVVDLLQKARQTHEQTMPLIDSVYRPVQTSDYYDAPIDPADFELNYEDLRNHYSTQIAFSTDVWREAYIFDSLSASSGARVFRIPGTTLNDCGTAFVTGRPHATVTLKARARDCGFGAKGSSVTTRLNDRGVARLGLKRSS